MEAFGALEAFGAAIGGQIRQWDGSLCVLEAFTSSGLSRRLLDGGARLVLFLNAGAMACSSVSAPLGLDAGLDVEQGLN